MQQLSALRLACARRFFGIPTALSPEIGCHGISRVPREDAACQPARGREWSHVVARSRSAGSLTRLSRSLSEVRSGASEDAGEWSVSQFAGGRQEGVAKAWPAGAEGCQRRRPSGTPGRRGDCRDCGVYEPWFLRHRRGPVCAWQLGPGQPTLVMDQFSAEDFHMVVDDRADVHVNSKDGRFYPGCWPISSPPL